MTVKGTLIKLEDPVTTTEHTEKIMTTEDHHLSMRRNQEATLMVVVNHQGILTIDREALQGDLMAGHEAHQGDMMIGQGDHHEVQVTVQEDPHEVQVTVQEDPHEVQMTAQEAHHVTVMIVEDHHHQVADRVCQQITVFVVLLVTDMVVENVVHPVMGPQGTGIGMIGDGTRKGGEETKRKKH